MAKLKLKTIWVKCKSCFKFHTVTNKINAKTKSVCPHCNFVNHSG